MDECAANQVESALDGIWEILALHPWDLILSKHTHEHTCVLCAVHLCNL